MTAFDVNKDDKCTFVNLVLLRKTISWPQTVIESATI